jgi:hypothetical protein
MLTFIKEQTDHLYVPTKDKVRGPKQIEGVYIAEIISLEKYVEHKEDPLIQIVRTDQCNTNSALFQTVSSG